ncbi:MAG TPA: multicopper oxidase domain-containing protein [Thermomicrobiales bacterium]|nr:multicopper oxidase domain-containing protein [Thermomicrobiales bacterium]
MLKQALSRRAALRRGLIGGGTLGGMIAVPALAQPRTTARPAMTQDHAEHDMAEGHSLSSTVGDVDLQRLGWDPSVFATTFDYGEATKMQDGTVVREWEINAVDREIEIAPGIFFPAWTYNGQVPGPTLRCNEGDRLRIHFGNGSSHPHTIHFHGIHSAYQDGVTGIGRGDILPGDRFTYEFTARPFGCHLYHCHSTPLKRHIHKGLYGGFIVNPDPARHGDRAKVRHPDHPESEPWQEFIMVMNGFDTTFDAGNEVYAVNTVAFHYMKHPLVIDRTRPVRIYLINLTEFDPINSFHLHANFFDYYDHGTNLEPTLRTVDTIMQAQAQRGILEFSFADHEPGLYMFHAHVSEFAELGWMSMFDVQ